MSLKGKFSLYAALLIDLKQLQSVVKENIDIAVHLARLYIQLNDGIKAEEALQSALDQNPNHTEVKFTFKNEKTC